MEQGYVRIVNNLAVPPNSSVTAGPIRLLVAGNEVGPTAAVGAAAPYQAVAVGSPAVQIMLPYTSGTGYVQLNALPVAKDKHYSLFTWNVGTFHTAKAVEDPVVPAAAAGKAYIRIVNITAQATPVRIEEAGAAAPLYSEVSWGAVTGYQAVDARAYALNVSRTNGTQARLFTQTVALASGKAYALVLRGSTDASAAPSERAAFDVVVDE
ncbi:hypothetical protein B0919_10220 [Hymenobacter sp. CRA2]|nr:hypothetical protein B0919_10220 [Hymenobacter sp. CRA2]